MADDLDALLAPRCKTVNLDRYVMRTAILHAFTSQLPRFHGRFLDVGAGNQPYRALLGRPPSRVTQYVPLDLHDNGQYQDAEFTWDGVRMPFESNSFDSAMATEVLEHCAQPEMTLSEVARVLKPDGFFFLTVPFVWPLHDCPHDEYRYTPWSLERHLNNSGFTHIHLWPTGGWDAALAQTIGLWVRRRPMQDWKRRWLSRVLLPVVSRLARKDAPVTSFHHGFYLMPGIAATARAV